VQWLAAVEGPPHLKAMVPAMTFATANMFFYAGGVWDNSWAGWVWEDVGGELHRRHGVAGPTTDEEAERTWDDARQRVLWQLPLAAVPDFKPIAPWYYEWMRHPPWDPWWDWADLRARYGRTGAAVLGMSGWYDEAYGPDGATTNFTGLTTARAGGQSRAGLVIGPWPHGVVGTGRTKAGDRENGPDATIDYDETVLRWMDRYVRDLDNGVDREPPVRVFVMGDNRWREADRWPIPGTRADTLYLAAPTYGSRTGELSARRPTSPIRQSRSPIHTPIGAAHTTTAGSPRVPTCSPSRRLRSPVTSKWWVRSRRKCTSRRTHPTRTCGSRYSTSSRMERRTTSWPRDPM
jgi:uncharacterized protein